MDKSSITKELPAKHSCGVLDWAKRIQATLSARQQAKAALEITGSACARRYPTHDADTEGGESKTSNKCQNIEAKKPCTQQAKIFQFTISGRIALAIKLP